MMNEIRATIKIKDFMDTPDGWGREQGHAVFQKLLSFVESNQNISIFKISMDGVKRIDASFPRESIMELAKRYQSKKGFYLTDIVNIDIIDNLDAAALKKEQPIYIWNGDEFQQIGAQPSTGLKDVLNYAVQRVSVTATEISEKLNIKMTNTSTKLKKLVSDGFLIRQEESAASGGKEYRYYRIK